MTIEFDPFAAFDKSRIWRLLELSDMRALYHSVEVESQKILLVRAATVISYAHWEGYYADCCEIYYEFIEKIGVRCVDVNEDISLALITSEFDRLFSRGNNVESKLEFYRSIRKHEERSLKGADRSLIKPRSNLNFDRLRFSLDVLGGDIGRFQKLRIRLDNELVRARHSVAHGGAVELDEKALDELTRLSEALMQTTKGVFEDLIAKVSTSWLGKNAKKKVS